MNATFAVHPIARARSLAAALDAPARAGAECEKAASLVGETVKIPNAAAAVVDVAAVARAGGLAPLRAPLALAPCAAMARADRRGSARAQARTMAASHHPGVVPRMVQLT